MVTIEKKNYRYTFFDHIREQITKGERFMFYFNSDYWIKKEVWERISTDEAEALTGELTLVCIWPKGAGRSIPVHSDRRCDYVYSKSFETLKSVLDTL